MAPLASVRTKLCFETYFTITRISKSMEYEISSLLPMGNHRVMALACRASLQRLSDQQILTPRQVYDFASLEIENIEILWMGEDARRSFPMYMVREKLPQRPSMKQDRITNEHPKKMVLIYIVSGDSVGSFHRIGSVEPAAPTQTCALHPGNYVARHYDQHSYAGSVSIVGEEDFSEVEVSFMEDGDEMSVHTDIHGDQTSAGCQKVAYWITVKSVTVHNRGSLQFIYSCTCKRF